MNGYYVCSTSGHWGTSHILTTYGYFREDAWNGHKVKEHRDLLIPQWLWLMGLFNMSMTPWDLLFVIYTKSCSPPLQNMRPRLREVAQDLTPNILSPTMVFLHGNQYDGYKGDPLKYMPRWLPKIAISLKAAVLCLRLSEKIAVLLLDWYLNLWGTLHFSFFNQLLLDISQDTPTDNSLVILQNV